MNNPNRTRTQNFGFFPISSVSKGKYVLLIKVINCKVQGSKKLECWTYRVVRKTDMCSRFDSRHNIRVWRTDGQTDRTAMSISCVSVGARTQFTKRHSRNLFAKKNKETTTMTVTYRLQLLSVRCSRRSVVSSRRSLLAVRSVPRPSRINNAQLNVTATSLSGRFPRRPPPALLGNFCKYLRRATVISCSGPLLG